MSTPQSEFVAPRAGESWPLTRAQVRAIRWRLHPANPLIAPPWPSPIIADPTFLLPAHSPDGRWHLFAHSLWGIHHFVSADSLHWQRARLIQRNALRPCLWHDDNGYTLVYERARRGRLPLHWLPGRPWHSWIEAIHSPDLRHWSAPITLLEPALAWHQAAQGSAAVSNPCLVQTAGTYLLYYSAGLQFLTDCGFNEPAAIGLAQAEALNGPYTPLAEPLLQADPARRWGNLAAGAMKVRQVLDGWVAFQNAIYWDARIGHSGSAILLLESADGLSWREALADPVLAPGAGWMRSHVYALDVHLDRAGQLYLFFNARNDWPWTRGVEHIGLLTGQV